MQCRRPGYSRSIFVTRGGCRAQVIDDLGIGAAGVFCPLHHPELGAGGDHQRIIEADLHAACQINGFRIKSKKCLPGIAVAINALLVDLVHLIGKGLRQAVQRSAGASQHLRPKGQNA